MKGLISLPSMKLEEEVFFSIRSYRIADLKIVENSPYRKFTLNQVEQHSGKSLIKKC
jgi:hypothetical protein